MSADLTDAHIEAQARLRKLTAGAIAGLWGGLADYDEAQVPGFTQTASGLVLAAQRQSVALTNAFVARKLERQPQGVDVAAVLATVRPGVTPQTQWRRPFVTVWTALMHGTRFADAVAAGGDRAVVLAEADVQMASRATFAAVEGDGVRGWVRAADGGACQFCVAIDGAFVKSADAMPLHPRCGCTLEPVTDDVRSPGPLPDTVAVHEHGELGPTLGAPDHNFTSEQDI